jgi:hypothetical protein
MIQTNNEQYVTKNSDSKNRDSSKVILNSKLSNQLSSSEKFTGLLCYVCADDNPQFTGSLFDGRGVSYCGDCFAIVLQFKELKK